MPIAFEELEGSPTLHVAADEVRAQRVFKVPWNDRFELIAALWGSYRAIGGQFTFTPPAHFPDLPNVLADSIRLEPFDAASPLGEAALTNLSVSSNSYEAAKVTVGYKSHVGDEDKSRRPKHPQGTILSYSADLAAEYVIVPGRTWHWSVAGDPVLADDINPGILIPCEDIQLSWRRVPLPPWAAIRSLRGKVNESPFMDHNAGTVLFLGARIRRDFQIVDTGLWRLDYHFKAKEITSTADGTTLFGWNHFYRQEASSGEHWVAVEDEDGNPPYAEGDFSALFEFEGN